MHDDTRHWHVTLTLTGDATEQMVMRAALLRLTEERPFLDSVRFNRERVELQFWDQGETMLDVASLALRLWDEHRTSAVLPPRQVVGLEVVERHVYDERHSGSVSSFTGSKLSPLPL